MSVFLVVKGGKIELKPDTSWAWDGFNGETDLNGGQSLLNIKGEPVVIETDFPQIQNIGKKYTTQIHSTPGMLLLIELSVDSSTLSTEVFSKTACVTEKTEGTFQAIVAQPALTPDGKPDLILSKNGQWQVVECEQDIMAVEATAPQSLFLKKKESQVSVQTGNQNKVVKEQINIGEKEKIDKEKINVELFYYYQDDTPVCKASYKIKDSDNQELTGFFSDKGIACVTVSEGQIEIECGEDTRDYKPNKEAQSNPIYASNLTSKQITQKEPTEKSGHWSIVYDVLIDNVLEPIKLIWGIIQGDFNKEPTTFQIIANTVITMLPILDQVGDARDLTANIITLSDNAEREKIGNWTNLLITLIGCVPTFGSFLKGLFKAILKESGKLTKSTLLATSRSLGKGDPEKLLKQIDWEDYTKQSINTFENVIDKTKNVIQDLDKLAGALSEEYAKWFSKRLHSLLDSLESTKVMSKDKLSEAMNLYRKEIDKALTGKMVKKKVYLTVAKTKVAKLSNGSNGVKSQIKTEELAVDNEKSSNNISFNPKGVKHE
ncbi:hypothetical protein [Candidatus Parabeggiatoa sp. HSG14]|uniref:hypothetical protein n=1 Tax=Candidatus Parabeggiatoa sp. HSG14 TaxID=3055593 RepID=UPI0025A6DC82|nr:hypothetical protein [Thiotrichales bacterium HSG14]